MRCSSTPRAHRQRIAEYQPPRWVPKVGGGSRLCGSPFVHATPVVKRDRPKRDTPHLARLSPATGGVSGDDRVCAVTALSSLPDCVPVGGRPASAPCSLHHMAPTISHEMPTSRVPSPVDALLSSRDRRPKSQCNMSTATETALSWRDPAALDGRIRSP